MRIPDKLFNIRDKKTLKTLLSILLALLISLALAVTCILFTPSIFNSTLHKGLELLPKNKFIEYKVQSKTELAKEWLEESDGLRNDKSFFEQLRTKLPNSSNKDSFFAHMFVVHDYPAPCFFTLFGKHRTMDVTWTVTGIRCRGAKECNDPQFIDHCPPRKSDHQ
ncbi:MAG: hypothetical protein ACJAZP_003196 [Psychromonas sp.]|jgi:hypothetical protein|uniref:hypothetical protein n=1 Tax=Psychromonas sp. TaxID=1884585 RepID=UPI0039E48ADC